MTTSTDAQHAAHAVLALPTHAPPYAGDDAGRYEVLMQSTQALAQLKAANRAAYAAQAAARAQVRTARDEVDAAARELQHLIYERTQLEAQIAACEALDTVYEEVPLRPMDAFLAHAPEESRTPAVCEDAHLLLVHRLQFELEERRRCVTRLTQAGAAGQGARDRAYYAAARAERSGAGAACAAEADHGADRGTWPADAVGVQVAIPRGGAVQVDAFAIAHSGGGCDYEATVLAKRRARLRARRRRCTQRR